MVTRKEKKKHHYQEQAWKDFIPATGVSTSSTSSGARKDLNHITRFNGDKKSHYATKCPKSQRCLRRLVTVWTTSTLITGTPCYPGMRSLYLIPGLSPKRLRRSHGSLNGQDSHKSHVGFDSHNSHDGHKNHNGHDGHDNHCGPIAIAMSTR